MVAKFISIFALVAVCMINSSNAGLSSGLKAASESDSNEFIGPPPPEADDDAPTNTAIQPSQSDESQQQFSGFNYPQPPQEEDNIAPTNAPKKPSKKPSKSMFQQSQSKSQQQLSGFNFQPPQPGANNKQQSQSKFPTSVFQQFSSFSNPMQSAPAGDSGSSLMMKMIAQQQSQLNKLLSAAGSFQQQLPGFNRVNSQKSSYPESNSKPSSKTNQKSQVSTNTDNNNYQNAMPDFLQSMMSSMMNNFGQQQLSPVYRRDVRNKEIANDEE